MSTEHTRFLALFDALVKANNAWLTGTPAAKWSWVPVENSHMKFGDRISTINIRNVYIHTIVGEVGWADMLRDCAPNASLKPDGAASKQLTQRLEASSDLVADTMELHAENVKKFADYSAETLDKPIQWVGRDWTVMGFLWGIYSHRSYHLGNIDILMREADEKAPDFFSNFQQQMA